MVHPVLEAVTNDVIERSKKSRATYLARVDAAAAEGPHRAQLACGNLVHGFISIVNELSHVKTFNISLATWSAVKNGDRSYSASH